jgi:hypothetical protein
MHSALLILLGIVIGGGGGVVGGGMIGTGLGAGAGIVTGLKSGACLTVEAAKDQGLITAEQVAQIFDGVAKTVPAGIDTEGPSGLATNDAECQKVVIDLRAAIAANGQ